MKKRKGSLFIAFLSFAVAITIVLLASFTNYINDAENAHLIYIALGSNQLICANAIEAFKNFNYENINWGWSVALLLPTLSTFIAIFFKNSRVVNIITFATFAVSAVLLSVVYREMLQTIFSLNIYYQITMYLPVGGAVLSFVNCVKCR